MIVLVWERLHAEDDGQVTERARVLGGWLVRSRLEGGPVDALTFVPDTHAAWDGVEG